MASYTLLLISLSVALWALRIDAVSTVSPSAACTLAKAAHPRVFPQGCTGLVAELLGKPFVQAKHYTQGKSLGKKSYDFKGVAPGTIVGWGKRDGSDGHVAVYIGNKGCDCLIVDVPGPGKAVRCMKNGYGEHNELFIMSYPGDKDL